MNLVLFTQQEASEVQKLDPFHSVVRGILTLPGASSLPMEQNHQVTDSLAHEAILVALS